MVDISTIEPHPDNPRRGDLKLVVESIATNGFYGAVVAQPSRRRILAGEHRWRALTTLQADGWKPPKGRTLTYGALAKRVTLPPLGKVPVSWFDCDDDTAKKVLLIDNRANDRATYDDESLAALLRDLHTDGDLAGTGFTGRDVTELLAKIDVPDLDDLHAKLGEPSPQGSWPVLRLKVSPETAKLWREVAARIAGQDHGDDEVVRAILRAASEGVK